ncbi:MAG TPA: hypothetical protein PLX89_23530 [Verrucomicrobiota bacterium]|nr:hypothetical protein [Verrucomicrobiales bacterium]HRI15980.1 hypothetical protein [Verrucomicrobiota bacterium]
MKPRLFLTYVAMSLTALMISADDWTWHDALIVPLPDGSHRIRLAGKSTVGISNTQPFRVVTASTWPAGLVPVFEIERDGRYELRRRPPAGRENTTDPLFFALAPLTEPDSGQLTGRWQIQSTNSNGGKHWTFFELTTYGERVVGRFDQNTDFRFGFITGGVWRSNALTLNAEYIQDRYQLEAAGRDGQLIGTWRKTDDSEHGWWTGTRAILKPSLPLDAKTMPLWEWHRTPDRSRRYGFDTNAAWEGWERTSEPLCRVWLP